VPVAQDLACPCLCKELSFMFSEKMHGLRHAFFQNRVQKNQEN